MAAILFLAYLVFSLLVLYHGAKAWVWESATVVYLLTTLFIASLPWYLSLIVVLFIAAILLFIHLEPLGKFISDKLYAAAKKSLPRLTKTEEEALNAGDTWLEKDLFIGAPNWERLAKISSSLSEEEQAFLDNETEELCSMLDEWSILQENDLPEEIWNFMKVKGFFGLVIGKEYGGRGFSAGGHAAVVCKLSSRSGVAAVTCMVPNSLGPGELLHYYGTEEQKNEYLPKLAKGVEIPCFALTEPGAGSDATSIQSEAIVKRGLIDGKEVTGLVINRLNKRWITLAPVATLIGLAVNLKDPEGLLKGEGQEGITCLLIPRSTENLEIGNRHLPASQTFMNGSIRGENIFVPISSIIGGQKNAGRGWQMLVECLSIGRSISLPSLAGASSSVAYLTSGAFARIRRQFNVELAQFEGIEEKLAEVAGLNYLINATRFLTLAAVNEHKKPSVASAIAKCFNTELARITVNDAMDLHGGRAVVVGPRNYLSGYYQGIPISITVEGANIMTRNLLIFGQGSMACHPYIRDEFYAIANDDKKAFTKLLWSHIHYFMQNFAKTILSAWTGGIFIRAPKNALSRDYKNLARLSHAFAFLADFSLIYLGGELKRKERLSARLADALSYLYMAMAALRQYEDRPKDEAEIIHAKWAVAYSFYHAQRAMLELCQNFPGKVLRPILKFLAFPFGQSLCYPKDALGKKLAKAMASNNAYRDSLKKMIYLSGDSSQAIDKVENCFQELLKYGELYKKVPELRRCAFADIKTTLEAKLAKGDLKEDEMQAILELERLRWDAIQVDEFTFESMQEKKFVSVADLQKNPID